MNEETKHIIELIWGMMDMHTPQSEIISIVNKMYPKVGIKANSPHYQKIVKAYKPGLWSKQKTEGKR